MLLHLTPMLSLLLSMVNVSQSFRSPSRNMPSSCLSMISSPPQKSRFRRFFETTLFFNGPRFLSGRRNENIVRGGYTAGDTVWDSTDTVTEWGPLDDIVMGGVSNSFWSIGDGIGIWQGTVSTDNNGGFCGVRTRNIAPPLNLGKCKGVRLEVRGDGQSYKLTLRDSTDFNGVSWTKTFETKANNWIKVEIPFRSLIPTRLAQ